MSSRRSFLSRAAVFLGGASAVPLLVADTGTEPQPAAKAYSLDVYGVYLLDAGVTSARGDDHLVVMPRKANPYMLVQGLTRYEAEKILGMDGCRLAQDRYRGSSRRGADWMAEQGKRREGAS